MPTKPYKYVIPLTDEDTVLELHGEILHVDWQGNRKLNLWAEYNEEVAPIRRVFRVIETGHPIPVNGRHLKTVLMEHSVWHVYEVTS